MRLRNRPWAKPLIEENPQYVVTEPQQFKGKWQTRFEKPAPLFVEVGMGKGQFSPLPFLPVLPDSIKKIVCAVCNFCFGM